MSHSNPTSTIIPVIEKLLETLGHCDEGDYSDVEVVLRQKFVQAKNDPSPRLVYLRALDAYFGEQACSLTNDEHAQKYDELIEQAAELGVPEAQYQHANRLYEVRDYEAAVVLYAKSAEQGYPPAQHAYGLDLYRGLKGVEADRARGLFYLELAAGRLNIDSIEFLISLYEAQRTEEEKQKYRKYSNMLVWAEAYKFHS